MMTNPLPCKISMYILVLLPVWETGSITIGSISITGGHGFVISGAPLVLVAGTSAADDPVEPVQYYNIKVTSKIRSANSRFPSSILNLHGIFFFLDIL